MRQSILFAISAAVACVAGLVAVTARASEPVAIRVAWVSAPGQLIPLLYDEGYRNLSALQHYGKTYTVEAVHFNGSAPQITALAANELDIAGLAFSSLVLAIENAHMSDIRVIGDYFQSGAGSYLSERYMVRSDSGIAKVEDLKGRILAVNAFGGALDIALKEMLKKHGLKQGDYSEIEAQIPNMVPALQEKKVDLISVGMPWAEEATERANAKTLFTMHDAIGVVQELVMAARAKFLADHRAALNDFFEDYVRGLQWFFDPAHRDAALQIVARFNKRQPSDYASYVFTDKDYYRDPYAAPNAEALQNNMDLMPELGLSKTRVNLAPYLDLSFVQETKKRLGSAMPPGWH